MGDTEGLSRPVWVDKEGFVITFVLEYREGRNKEETSNEVRVNDKPMWVRKQTRENRYNNDGVRGYIDASIGKENLVRRS